MTSQVPQDVQYTDLTPAQAAFLQRTVPLEAKALNCAAAITSAAQADGTLTVTIHYSPISPDAAPVASAMLSAPETPAATPAVFAQGISFAAGGLPLLQSDIDAAATTLGNIDPKLIWAIIRKESPISAGFYPSRRPVILYERHIFAQLTGDKYTASNPLISGPPYKDYGSYDDQYTRLISAMALDKEFALQSCSWGVGQVLGENAGALSYGTAVAMVAEMIKSEGAQLTAMVRFLQVNSLVGPLGKLDWDGFSKIYNGGSNPAYAGELHDCYTYFATNGLPDIDVRTAQLGLTYLGYGVTIDGRFGGQTQTAIKKFQTDKNLLPATGNLDDTVKEAIRKAAFGS